MTYCMADIHGEIERYREMLQKIQFSDTDTLYIIGDVIDRNPGGVNILRDIMSRKNVILLRGNHEQMCLSTLGKDNEIGARQLWEQNGGDITYVELRHKCSAEERQSILSFIEKTPLTAKLQVGKRTFLLVHAVPDEDMFRQLWMRPWDFNWADAPKNTTCVIGHTPVNYLKSCHEDTPMSIYYAEKYICIDCGCAGKNENRRLACLRLDDMAEFYT